MLIHQLPPNPAGDTNYGNLLSVYDRVLATFTPTAKAFSVAYGLDDVQSSQRQTVAGLLAMPFRNAEQSHAAAGVAGRNVA